MLVLVLILVVIALVLLLAGWFLHVVVLAWMSVGISVLAGLVLFYDWWQTRSALRAGDRSEAAATERADHAAGPDAAGYGGDVEPATQVLPVVRPAGRAGHGGADDGVDATDATVRIPVVRPSVSDEGPSGASRSSGSSSPSVTDVAAESRPPTADSHSDGAGAAVTAAAAGAAAGPTGGPGPQGSAEWGHEGRGGDPVPPDAGSHDPGTRSGDTGHPAAGVAAGVHERPQTPAAPDDAGAAGGPVTTATSTGTTAGPTAPADGAGGGPGSAAPVTTEDPGTARDPGTAGDPAAGDPAHSGASATTALGAAGAGAAAAGATAATSAGTRETPDAPGGPAGDDPGTPTGDTDVPPAGGDSRSGTDHGAAPEGDAPEEPRDPTLAGLVARLPDEVLVIDEHPRYHVQTCRALSGRPVIPLPVSEAVELGFSPCGWCAPNRTLGERHPAQAR